MNIPACALPCNRSGFERQEDGPFNILLAGGVTRRKFGQNMEIVEATVRPGRDANFSDVLSGAAFAQFLWDNTCWAWIEGVYNLLHMKFEQKGYGIDEELKAAVQAAYKDVIDNC